MRGNKSRERLIHLISPIAVSAGGAEVMIGMESSLFIRMMKETKCKLKTIRILELNI